MCQKNRSKSNFFELHVSNFFSAPGHRRGQQDLLGVLAKHVVQIVVPNLDLRRVVVGSKLTVSESTLVTPFFVDPRGEICISSKSKFRLWNSKSVCGAA